MRLLPISLICTLFASVAIAESSEERLGSSEETLEETPDLADPTIFNGIQVPPLIDIEGEKFNATVKDGYWFVKHHS
jgi:protein disulfide-isomerase